MNEPEIVDGSAAAFPLDLAESEAETAPQEQDDLCHGIVGEHVWYCPECQQYFDHPVPGPHPKPLPRMRTHPPLPVTLPKRPKLVQVGICQTCGKPFLGQDRCQCKPVTRKSPMPGQAQLVMVQTTKRRGKVA